MKALYNLFVSKNKVKESREINVIIIPYKAIVQFLKFAPSEADK